MGLFSSTEKPNYDDVSNLKERFPTLSENELKRFKRAFVKSKDKEDTCIQKLEHLIQFKELYGLNNLESFSTTDTDADVWKWAQKTAIDAAGTKDILIPGMQGCVAKEKRICKSTDISQPVHCYHNDDGSLMTTTTAAGSLPVLQHMSGMLDMTIMSEEIQILALALYLFRTLPKICKDDSTQIFFIIDTRKGTGWKNGSVFEVRKFLQMLSHMLHDFIPYRMNKMIIFPVPKAAMYAFTMLKAVMPKEISELIILLNGRDEVDDPAPKDELEAVGVPKELVEKCEAQRRSQYIFK